MNYLKTAILLYIFVSFTFTTKGVDSPHGKALRIDCAKCHQTENWKNIKENGFNHATTSFPLTGQHRAVACIKCHSTNIFTDAKNECVSCHTDIHEGTLGKNCETCHNTDAWIVTNSKIRQIHQYQGFPLLGVHAITDCIRCHSDASKTRYNKIRSDCYACHQLQYEATQTPNHKEAGFDTDCARCHNVNAQVWAGAGYNHSFFPLKGGHSGLDCKKCHISGYKGLSSDCVSCHLTDYNNAKNPLHTGFSKDCKSCHTINAWQPAAISNHDAAYFPIYSGKHKGTWNKCSECHTNVNNYKEFSCINCHEHNQSKMNHEHDDVRGYVYNSKNCFQCHPRGRSEDD